MAGLSSGAVKPDNKPTFPYFVFFIFELLAIILYGIRVDRSRYQHIVLFFAIAGAIAYCLCFTWIDGEVMKEKVANTGWGVGCRLAGLLLSLSANFVLMDPLRDIKLVEEGADKKKDEKNASGKASSDMYDKPFLSRLWWGVVVSGNPRGVNFQYASDERPKSTIARPTHTSRLSFIFSQIRSFAFLFLLYDLCDTVNLLNPHYTSLTEPSADQLAIFGSHILGRLIWAVANLAYGISIWLILDMEYIVFSLVGVSLGISKPRDWPDLFGSPLDAWTLRGLWGKSWHQTFRRASIVHANFFLRILGFPTYRSASKSQRRFIRTFILLTVFFLTGLIHYVGDAIWMQNANIFDKNGPGAMHFYLLQPVGIALEDLVISLFAGSENRKTSTSWKLKALGFLWVTTWISMTLPLWIYPQYRQGYKYDMPHPMMASRLLGLDLKVH